MRRVYEFVDRHFRPPYDTGQPGGTLEKLLEDSRVAPCRAVDLGCGTGRNAIYLAQPGAAGDAWQQTLTFLAENLGD